MSAKNTTTEVTTQYSKQTSVNVHMYVCEMCCTIIILLKQLFLFTATVQLPS